MIRRRLLSARAAFIWKKANSFPELMTTFGFIAKNALRNKRRALLSVLSVAVSLFLFVMLQVGMREMTLPVEAVGSATRVIVRHKISLGQMLPESQRVIIERIPGVEAVSPFTW